MSDGQKTKERMNFPRKIAGINPDAPERDDDQFNDNSQKDEHELKYTKILDAYADNIEETLKKKRTYKTWVFWLSFSLLAGVSVLLVVLLVFLVWKKPLEGVAEWCSVVVPATVSFLTVFLVIPRVITEYLFNSEEEKYMSEIIKNIQDYDKGSHDQS